MYLSTHALLNESRGKRGAKSGDLLDFLLGAFANLLQEDFSCFADGGAGIGGTSKNYHKILTDNLNPSAAKHISIYCYEPLVENFKVLTEYFSDQAGYVLRNVALASSNGSTSFTVPTRVTEDVGSWREGTSYNGFVGTANYGESIEVKTVRLSDETENGFDFVKLDLQGGEYDALVGLGKKIADVKMLYIEHQLLRKEESIRLLTEQNFGVFFDRLQFGLKPNAHQFSLRQLEDLGIIVEKLWSPNKGGIGLVLWGYFSKMRDMIDPDTLSLRPEISSALSDIGISYMQTDAIAINSKYISNAFDFLNRY